VRYWLAMLTTDPKPSPSEALFAPGDAPLDVLFQCWEALKQKRLDAFEMPSQTTVWHLIAAWTDMDWFKIELAFRRFSNKKTELEELLDGLYTLDDEFRPDALGRTPMSLSWKNVEWPYLRDWWMFKRQTLEHTRLTERYPSFSFPDTPFLAL
jgi:hypothetical protein